MTPLLLLLIFLFTLSENTIKTIWERRATEWHQFVGNTGSSDLNRFYQSDPVLC